MQTDLNKKEEELQRLRQQIQGYNRDAELKGLQMVAGVTPLGARGGDYLTDVTRRSGVMRIEFVHCPL